jgi:hypothetical protein
MPTNKNVVGSDSENINARKSDHQAQSICLESCCQANCAFSVQNVEGQHCVETTCSHTHVEVHSPVKVETFLKENCTALH